ncbi:3595_t:CDS:2, partial [Diversispora eburnea]
MDTQLFTIYWYNSLLAYKRLYNASKWNISDKLSVAATDNASSIIKAIRVQVKNIQAKLANNQEEANILEPVSSDISTHWNSTYFILKRLLELRNAIEKLLKYQVSIKSSCIECFSILEF